MHTRLVAGMIAAFAVSSAVVSAEQQRPAFRSASQRSLPRPKNWRTSSRALSRRVDPNEAKLLAECAYATVARLRQEYRTFGTPIFNNFLVYHGWRKRGYCFNGPRTCFLRWTS